MKFVFKVDKMIHEEALWPKQIRYYLRKRKITQRCSHIRSTDAAKLCIDFWEQMRAPKRCLWVGGLLSRKSLKKKLTSYILHCFFAQISSRFWDICLVFYLLDFYHLLARYTFTAKYCCNLRNEGKYHSIDTRIVAVIMYGGLQLLRTFFCVCLFDFCYFHMLFTFSVFIIIDHWLCIIPH